MTKKEKTTIQETELQLWNEHVKAIEFEMCINGLKGDDIDACYGIKITRHGWTTVSKLLDDLKIDVLGFENGRLPLPTYWD